MTRKPLATSLVLAMFALSSPLLAEKTADSFSPYVDAKGNISLPDDFRKDMAHIGSWFAPEGEASGFHDVYMNQSAVEAYRETGKFADGSVLVKELRSSKAGNYTTGQGVSYATAEVKQWFVMVKDTQNRFKDNPNWGEGWGWALYKTDDPSKNVSKDYKTDCLGCHVPAKQNDWIYIEGYPTLLKPEGKKNMQSLKHEQNTEQSAISELALILKNTQH